MLPEPKCHKRKCVYFEGAGSFDRVENREFVYCKAFPRGIPDEIAYGDNPHDKVEVGQVGDYIFTKK